MIGQADSFVKQYGPRESMEYDVVIVGGGPAGLSSAIRLKQLARERGVEVSVCVLEKESEVGGHILSGAVMDPRALNELLPDWKTQGGPLDVEVTEDRFLFLSKDSARQVPNWLLPDNFKNHGNYIVSLANVTRWLGEQAEASVRTALVNEPSEGGGYMKIQSVCVVGAGTMGNGIAQIAAVAGFKVLMIDVAEAALAKGLATLTAGLDRLVSKGKLDVGTRDLALNSIKTSTEYARLANVDIVIEAATENLVVKERILQEIESVARADAIIATNTSSISITVLAATLRSPERFVGMHFFNPVPVLQLVEVIRGLETSDATAAAVHQLTEALHKTPISVRNSPGFAVNRVLVPMINESFYVLYEGVATAHEIDAGMRLGANHPMGPLALADLIDLTSAISVMDVLHRDLGDSKYRLSTATRIRLGGTSGPQNQALRI